jgi:hypothetical protein
MEGTSQTRDRDLVRPRALLIAVKKIKIPCRESKADSSIRVAMLSYPVQYGVCGEEKNLCPSR